ncbi:MAG TPA: hypothetical protein VFD04_21465 [Actinomycetes bacterium]|nr:hypothetical protein [Actinomycetes bacterium]
MPNGEELPYRTVQFTSTGAVFDAGEAAALLDMAAAPGTTDLLVLCHGWNNTMDEAKATYDSLLRLLRQALAAGQVSNLGDRSFAVFGVLWPSKKWADKDLIAGHAAGVEPAVSDAVLLGQLEELKQALDDPAADAAVERAKQLVPLLEDRQTARQEFAEALLSTVPRTAADEEDATSDLFALPGDEVMRRLSKPVLPAAGPSAAGQGGATSVGDPTGHAAGFFKDLLSSGPKGAALKLMNFLTYYQMKERAGTVGAGGVYDLLRQVRDRRPDIALHMVGHSFGARLATAATAGPPGKPPVQADSLTLLQAAFSHYGFAQRWDDVHDGFFRAVVANHLVAGPVLITYTKNDLAVGYAYPLASLLRNQVAAGLGDKNDRFGGLGRNGAQKTPEAGDGLLLGVGQAYDFSAGRLYNLNADAVITSHGDIAKEQVTYALLTAIAGTHLRS